MLFAEDPDKPSLFDEEEDLDDLVEVSATEVPALRLPRAQTEMLGHDVISDQLLHMFSTGRMPHGLIFAGPNGVGKSTMAFRLARFLLSQAKREDTGGPSLFGGEAEAPLPAKDLFVAPSHPVFAQVASGGHPDLLTIQRMSDDKTGRLKGSVSVEDIRRIAPFMRMTPSTEKGWRIVVIDDADTMTRSSQNSLLKILEEPPERALLILITHRSGALLTTIFSRCVVFNFSPLPEDQILSALEKYRLESSLQEIVVWMARGSLGKALEYVGHKDHLPQIKKTLALLTTGSQLDWPTIQAFAGEIGGKGNEDAQKVFEETMSWAASWLAKHVALGQTWPKNPYLTGIQELLAQLTLADSLKICDSLESHFEMVRTGNLDKRFLVMGAYMAFETR
jgi:DNA polymerase-3 subunit delta'